MWYSFCTDLCYGLSFRVTFYPMRNSKTLLHCYCVASREGIVKNSRMEKKGTRMRFSFPT